MMQYKKKKQVTVKNPYGGPLSRFERFCMKILQAVKSGGEN